MNFNLSSSSYGCPLFDTPICSQTALFQQCNFYVNSLSRTQCVHHNLSQKLVLVYFSVAVIMTDQKQLGGEKSLTCFLVTLCHQGQQVRNSGRNMKGELKQSLLRIVSYSFNPPVLLINVFYKIQSQYSSLSHSKSISN